MIVLWQDVPKYLRITENFLLNCNGGSDPRWVERHLYGRGCPAAVKLVNITAYADHIWCPCANKPYKNQIFCYPHLEVKRWDKIPTVDKDWDDSSLDRP